MSTIRRPRRVTAAAGAALLGGGLLLGASLTADAATQPGIPDALGVYTACYDTGGNVKLITASASCPKGWRGPVTWNQAGQPGPVGAPGPAGPAGADGAAGASAYDLWLTAGHTGTVADFLASLGGEQGAAGPTGPTGPAGPAGPQGDAGPAGESCTMTDNFNGTLTITCGSVEAVVTGRISGTPTLSVANPAAVVEGGAVDFVLTLSAATTHTVSVDYATSDGTAVAPADYQATSGTATIAAGETSTTISVPTVDDSVTEGTENFTLAVSSPHYATIATGSATAVIQDNDCTDSEPDTQATAIYLGSVSGDTTSAEIRANGSVCAGDEDWFRFTLTENDFGFADRDLFSHITLSMTSGSGDLDLYVYGSGGGLLAQSTQLGTTTEYLSLRFLDTFGDDTAQLFVKVVGATATAVNRYTLSIN